MRECKGNERSFYYSTIFYLVIFLDLSITSLFGFVCLYTVFDPSSVDFHDPAMFLLSIVWLINFTIDLIILNNKRRSPNCIDITICWIKGGFGFVGILTLISGLYFLIISVSMSRSPISEQKVTTSEPDNISIPAQPHKIPSKKTHHDVFISYAQNDKPIADATCAKLESSNIRCWISPRDVPPGENFPKAIIEGIEGSQIMVLIFSSYSNNSQHVIREITSAVNKGLIIIPFRIEDIIPSKEMEYLISTPHWLDAISPPLEQHLVTLINTIQKILSSDL